jgi:hypothetical protein
MTRLERSLLAAFGAIVCPPRFTSSGRRVIEKPLNISSTTPLSRRRRIRSWDDERASWRLAHLSGSCLPPSLACRPVMTISRRVARQRRPRVRRASRHAVSGGRDVSLLVVLDRDEQAAGPVASASPRRATARHRNAACREGPRLCENCEVKFAGRNFVSTSSIRKIAMLATTIGRSLKRKQFCAFLARARFHTARARNGLLRCTIISGRSLQKRL